VNIKKACAKRSPEKKTDIINKQKQTKAKKSHEEKADIKRREIETKSKKSDEEKALTGKRISETKRGSNNPRYINLTNEQELFIIQNINKGLSIRKNIKLFNDYFNKNFSSCIVDRFLNKK
jgi:predicted ATPase